MDNRLQELTEKIYREGVAKGNEEASAIVEQAKKQAEAILAEANKEAESIVEAAEKSAAELRKTTKAELELTGKQLIDAVKQEVTNLVNEKITKDSVKPAVSDPAFVKDMLKAALESWTKGEDVTIYASEKEAANLEKFIKASAKGIFDAKLTMETVNNIQSGFQIGPADGSYKISFSEADFEAFFKAYIRPRLAEILF